MAWCGPTWGRPARRRGYPISSGPWWGRAQRFVSKFWQECNYLQALEGGVDPAHISFLHGILDASDDELRRVLDRAAAGFGFAAGLERAPHLEVADRETGLLVAARREVPAGQHYWRITQYLLPFHTMPPPDIGSDAVFQSHVWIPVDDDHLVNWCISWHPTRALTEREVAQFRAGSGIHVTEYGPATGAAYGDIRPIASRSNDYLADWEAQRTSRFFGVPGVGSQDKAITESQGTYDRSLEHLGRGDLGIIRVRKRLLDAAIALRTRRTPPPGPRSRHVSCPPGLRPPAEGRPVGGGGEAVAGQPFPRRSGEVSR